MRPLRATTIMVMAGLLLSAALGAPGCQRTTGATDLPDKIVLPNTTRALEDLMSRQSTWRNVDRTALAASLGWGQVSRGNTAGKRIAITLDAGADAGPTAAVLDTLKAAGLHCTFFVTGQFATGWPALVQRMASEGHEVANHSWSHPKFPALSPSQVTTQVARTEETVRGLTGSSTKPYFRFPYGAGSGALVEQLNAEGYMGVLWTFDTLDSLGATAEAIRARASRYACPGAIVLMHCGSPEGAKALPGIIRDLKGAGYELVTLTEVLGPPRQP
ncbi:MAG: polysaccharide deacetylase family protein [Candidatus Geothermincolia bacterium]